MKVFIGGSRKITRLPGKITERLDRIIEKGFPVLVGDAGGADRAVQEYLNDRKYGRVEVFCMEGACRNNVGAWATRAVPAPKGTKGAAYYSIKDAEMTRESTIGLMIWDGRSSGTLANVSRLLGQGKKAIVYVAPLHDFFNLADMDDWKSFLGQLKVDSAKRVRGNAAKVDRHHAAY